MYKIKDWENHFENNKTRILKHLSWVPVPNKLDGDGYLTIMSHKDGAGIFGTWIAVVQVASKCHPRGTLVRDNCTAHTPATLSRITRIPEKLIQRMFEICSKDPIWIESNTDVPESGTPVPLDGQRTEGTELNGTEGTEKNIGAGNRAQPLPENFSITDQVKAWADKKGWSTNGHLEHFKDHHKARGTVFKNWDAALRTWITKANTVFKKHSSDPLFD